MADKEIIRPPSQVDFPRSTSAGFRFFQQIAQWVNNAIARLVSAEARLTTAESDIDTLQAAGYSKLVDHGDPAAADYLTAAFTCDNTWRDLDLSAIIPAGGKAVLMRVLITDATVGNRLRFRKNGNSNTINCPSVWIQAANVTNEGNLCVFCDTNRVIEYLGESAFDDIVVVVTGWFL